jgi:hypothetical protein
VLRGKPFGQRFTHPMNYVDWVEWKGFSIMYLNEHTKENGYLTYVEAYYRNGN